MKVYVVTSGSYSDYKIEAIFSTKELADEYVERDSELEWSDDCQIEIYDMDEPVDALVRSKNLFEYVYTFDKHFNFASYKKYSLLDLPKKDKPLLTNRADPMGLGLKGWRVRVYAENKEKAFKIATDVLHAHRHHLSIMPK